MIVDPITTPQGYKRLKMDVPFFACGYIQGTTDILKMTWEYEPVQPPNSIDGPSILDGFASDDWDEFDQEITNRGLTRPPYEPPNE